ncbi:ABC transporter substrate-binding protein [Aestuariispira insulae]|uniref:Amino acid/amide ABC transporter substrate-binding protein (HAAT family) n=1 Tax=Aestuariispira insulae TaxID=1461337 RepID=A0A3D9HX70_9PROT|nr:ABC transporter substrate-binding protein [Aestuariispira insulae]RED54010.1 amino acid/amide ABC transporter substrate-binding protein (HAAT family) [Aestuariispira insulae]
MRLPNLSACRSGAMIWVAILAVIFCGASRSFATEPYLLGMSTALTGPASELGQNMMLGVNVRLARRNADHGIHNRLVALKVLDDGYEPSRTAPNMRQLIEQDQVLAVIGNVGTPTAIAALPIANEERTLFFAPFTGAGALRRGPPDRYVINYRASYVEEMAAMVDALITHGGLVPEDIAFFTQRDGYGDAGYAGGIAALRRHGLADDTAIIHARYERNTLAVENALADMLVAERLPKAVILVGAYGPSARFMRLARQNGVSSLMLNISFVGGAPLANALEGEVDGVVVTQVVPHPNDTSLPIVREYREDMAIYAPSAELSFGSLEGYIAAKILLRAMAGASDPLTREGLVEAVEGLGRFDIGLGFPLEFSRQEHQASHRIWPTILKDGEFQPFRWDQIHLYLGKG